MAAPPYFSPRTYANPDVCFVLYWNFFQRHFWYDRLKPDLSSTPISLSEHSYCLYCDNNVGPQLLSSQFDYYSFILAISALYISYSRSKRGKRLGFVIAISEKHCLVVLFFFPSPPPTGQREITSNRGLEKEGRASAPNRHFVTRLFTDTTGHSEFFSMAAGKCG